MHRLINGVVLSRVGGEYLLIATRPAWNKCPYIKMISPIFAMFWRGLESEMSEKDIVQEIHEKVGVEKSLLDNLFVSIGWF